MIYEYPVLHIIPSCIVGHESFNFFFSLQMAMALIYLPILAAIKAMVRS